MGPKAAPGARSRLRRDGSALLSTTHVPRASSKTLVKCASSRRRWRRPGMPFPMWRTGFGAQRSAAISTRSPKDRSAIRIGLPKGLNIWGTHQCWIGFLNALGIRPENIIFSSDTSEDQTREFAKGRGTVDCCYPVKCMSGHYGELVFGHKKKINVLLSPMIYSLPSGLKGHV